MHISDGLRAYGIKRKAVILLVILPCLLISLNCLEASPQTTLTSPSHVSLGDSILIAGVFHYFDVTLPEDHTKLCIIAYNGETEPSIQERSEKNYYQWEYDNGVWRDASGYDCIYLDPSFCSKQNTTYSFYLSISQKANPGSWTIKILVDDSETSTISVQVVIGDFCLFFSSIIGVFEPTVKQRTLSATDEVRCSSFQKKSKTSETDVETQVDRILQRQRFQSPRDDTVLLDRDSFRPADESEQTQESIRSTISQQPRTTLRGSIHEPAKMVFFKKIGLGGFWSHHSESLKRFFIIIVMILLCTASILPMVALMNKNDPPCGITILNSHSYPIIGANWTVLFTTIGCADLTITAVNGTSWGRADPDADLRFLLCNDGNIIRECYWVNDSVFIPDFFSNQTCSEISHVLTPGVHVLRFQFGDDIAYAYNLATENWLQTSSSDFNNGTKTNINVSNGSFHLQERFYLRNFTRINNQGFEGSWPPSDWSESPAGSNWNMEGDRVYSGSYSADFDGASGSGGASGNLLSPSLNCSGSNVTAIYVKFWAYEDNADDGEYYLDYYDGTAWDQITRLDNFGSDVWTQYSQKITDSQYFKSNFQIRWRVVGLNNNEHVYVDVVNVTVERNESGFHTSGSLLSSAHDTTRNMPDYNTITVGYTLSSGTTLTTWVRAADTQANLTTASWFSTMSQVPDKRWVQWRINLTGDTYRTPTVTDVNLTWIYDNEYPVSLVNGLSSYWHKTTPLSISVTASDNGTGIKDVALYYNYSANNLTGWSGWNRYGTNDSTSPYSWSFSPPLGDGYYRFYSRAIDGELNIEAAPVVPSFDTSCGVDTVKPSSQLDTISPYWYVEPDRDVVITCSSANDALSGLQKINLYYRYRIDNASAWGGWIFFGSDTATPWSWTFTFPKAKGFYQFYGIAVDNAGNLEDPPSAPDNDTDCAYNSTKPYSEVNTISPYWHNTALTITAQATDMNGSGLQNVSLYYYYSADNISWSNPYFFGVDTTPWGTISWDYPFPNGTGYYRFYSLAVDNDTNVEYFTGNDTVGGYDGIPPTSQVDLVTPYWFNASGNPLTITVTTSSDTHSGVKNITLYYRHRATNMSSWNAAVSYGLDENTPWSWSFTFPDGNGQYQFYSRARDNAGNIEDPPSSPAYDTQCGYDISKPTSQVDHISPYNITVSPFSLTATASDDTKNVTLWYYFSTQNSSWWNPNWQYRKQLNITGKNQGYQMKIIIGNTSGGNVTCNSHAQNDFDDIRFVSYSDNSTILSYWLKNYTTGTQATFWVNNSRNDSSIWLYYGNSNATTLSSGDATFYFFDDFSNGLGKWVMDSWNTDSISVNQSQGNPSPTLKHIPDNTIPANRTYQDTRIRTNYKILNGIIEYDVYLAGTQRVIHQFGWRVNSLSWTNGYCWRLQNSAGDGGFFEFSAPTTWAQIGAAFPVVSTGTWYHVNINVSSSTYSSKITPSAPAGDSARSVTDTTKTTADYLVSQVHGVSMTSENYVLVDNVIVRKYRLTPPTWGSMGAEQSGYLRWNNASNPDTSLPWAWSFDFPSGFGYYWFYSNAFDLNGNREYIPDTADAHCHYIRPAAPVIQSYDLRNNTGSKLNNATGLLDVNQEYYFRVNVTSRYGWVYIDYIDIAAWFDEGSDDSYYNQTTGGNLNMYLRYENVTGNASFKLLWPKNEVQLITSKCTETIINASTRCLKIYFKPLNQTRWAASNNTWNATGNLTNDPYSWNFNVTATEMSGLKAWKRDEYGIYKFAMLLPDKNWVDVRAPPGYNATTNVVNITYCSNYEYNLSIYFEENLTNVSSGDRIFIANNVYICANADLNDDITSDMMFNGIREPNAIDIINTSGVFHRNNTHQYVHVQFNVFIPFGTIGGEYSAHVATKIQFYER